MDLIVGAGITGLSYAMFCRNADYIIVEKESEIGGYCKTIKRNGFTWDYSGHFFHFQDSEIEKQVAKGMDAESILKVNKKTHIKYKEILVDYPFQKNIHQLSKNEFIDCLYDLFINDVKSYDSFLEMLYCKFGKSITEKFLKPYNEKLYACDLNCLDKDAMGRFFPYADKDDIIRNFKISNNQSYNGTFDYPIGGAIEYVNSISNNVDKSRIYCDVEVDSVDIQGHVAKTVDGRIIKYDRLISTMPFPMLLSKAGIAYPVDVFTWNKVLVFNLGFNKKGKNIEDHWIYFPESKYCFYRVGFYDNILNEDRMSLYVEVGYPSNEIVDPEKVLHAVIQDLEKAQIIDETQHLIDYCHVMMNPAYVHINGKSMSLVSDLKRKLESNGVFSIGRYGSWTYCSIEDNIKEARDLYLKLNAV